MHVQNSQNNKNVRMVIVDARMLQYSKRTLDKRMNWLKARMSSLLPRKRV